MRWRIAASPSSTVTTAHSLPSANSMRAAITGSSSTRSTRVVPSPAGAARTDAAGCGSSFFSTNRVTAPRSFSRVSGLQIQPSASETSNSRRTLSSFNADTSTTGHPRRERVRAACARNVGLSSTIRMFVMALPHPPQQMAEVRPARLAGRDDEQLRDLELRRISVEEDEHLAHETGRERDVVVGADAEAQALFLPPGEWMIGVVGERAGELLVRRRQRDQRQALVDHAIEDVVLVVLDLARVMELRLRRQRGLGGRHALAAQELVADLLAAAPVHVEELGVLARAPLPAPAAGVRAEDALQKAVEVEVRIDAHTEAVLDGVDVPDVHGVVDGLDALAQRVPRLAVMAARAEAVRLQLADADAHFLEVDLAIEAALVADGVDLGDDVAQLGMALEEVDDLPDLIVEAGALRRIARRGVEARLLAEARREDDAKVLDAAESLVQSQHDVVRRQLVQSRNLLARIGGLAKERELEPDRADVGVALEPRGHVDCRVAMRFSGGEDELRKVEDSQISIETIVFLQTNEPVDVARVPDRQRIVAVDVTNLLHIQRVLRPLEQLR